MCNFKYKEHSCEKSLQEIPSYLHILSINLFTYLLYSAFKKKKLYKSNKIKK